MLSLLFEFSIHTPVPGVQFGSENGIVVSKHIVDTWKVVDMTSGEETGCFTLQCGNHHKWRGLTKKHRMIYAGEAVI